MGLARAQHDLAPGEGPGPVELVRREQDGPPLGRRAREDAVEHLASLGVESGVRFVEQQQAGLACDGDGEGEPAALTGGEAGVGHVGEPGEPQLLERGVGGGGPRARGACGEPEVLAHGQVVVAEGVVADERQLPAHRPPVDGQVVPEHLGLAAAQRQEPGQEAQQCGLPRAVAAREQDDLALGHVEIHPGQRRKASEQAHGGTETDDEGHSASGTVDPRSVRTLSDGGRVRAVSPRWRQEPEVRDP